MCAEEALSPYPLQKPEPAAKGSDSDRSVCILTFSPGDQNEFQEDSIHMEPLEPGLLFPAFSITLHMTLSKSLNLPGLGFPSYYRGRIPCHHCS